MHQQHLQLHHFQQHKWMCIHNSSYYISSSSTSGSNASTALAIHQLQQHNWMFIDGSSYYINSSSTTGCNASTAFATTPTPAAQLDNAIKSIEIYIISGITTRGILIPAAQLDAMHQQHLLPHQFQQHNWMQCINSICYHINSSSTTGCYASTALAVSSNPAAQLDAMHQQHWLTH
jgi:hypothetical protein